MKLADYVARFFADLGVEHAFVVAGGASLHLIHGVEQAPGITPICCHHEQSAAMAADAYSRVTRNLGVAIATSGPGATNLITGIAGCYYDSVPAVFLTGQVTTFRLSGDSGVRQTGFQETPIVEMCQPVTKYATQILDPLTIRYELEKAVAIARSGRPGPVLIDIPDDLQRAQIDPESLPGYVVEPVPDTAPMTDAVTSILAALQRAERPVIIAGWGVHLADAAEPLVTLAETLQVPVALTWGAADLLPVDHPLRIGTFGTHGARYANFAVQNADFVLSLGSRLDTKATGSPAAHFARGAWKAVVDIDPAELDKFAGQGLSIECLVASDANVFIQQLQHQARPEPRPAWQAQIHTWQQRYHHSREATIAGDQVDPYWLFSQLSAQLPEQAHIFSDTGSSIAWLMQAFEPRHGQRIWHDFNNTAMGWALPAALAAALAYPEIPVYCIVGDGSLMMNLQELATVATHALNIKILCLNNRGYSMIQQTQDQWLGGQYVASSAMGGLGFPQFVPLAQAFGIPAQQLADHEAVSACLPARWAQPGPDLLDILIDPRCRVIPQVRFGRPNEDSEPLLPREQFMAEMIVPILDHCREL